MQPAVYILASARYGTLYVGVTSDLVKRVWEHKQGAVGGFTSQHNITKLVWYEVCEDMLSAIHREKQLKRWRRKRKISLIQDENPMWHDLFDEIC